MKLTQEISDRINVLRFPLIVGVVYIHAYGTKLNLAGASIGVNKSGWCVDFFRDLISQGFARVAVPLFFLISGYLFFHGFSWSLDNYKIKLHSRVRSLLVPYIFWNLGTFIIYAIAQLLPLTSKLLANNHPIYLQNNIFDFLNTIFGLSIDPISYQFWFIRDLMVMVILVPILHLMLKTIPVLFISTLALLWYFELWPLFIPAALAALFFSFGGFLSVKKINLFKFDKWGVQLSITYIILLLLNVLTKKHEFNLYIHNLSIIFGIFTALYLSKFLCANQNLKKLLQWLSSCSFFIFAVHEPSLTIMKKLTYASIKPETNIMVLSIYVIIPLIVISISILLFMLLKKVTPRFLATIGGR